MGYLIIAALAAMFVWLASRNLNSENLQDMWSNNKKMLIQKDKIKDFNKAVGKLYYGYAITILVLGLPFLFTEEGSIWTSISVILLFITTVTMMVIFSKIEKKYKEKWAK
ncbi:MAG: hypothetical protein R3Y47_01510 [Lachnospiraceae bacterium]